MLDLLYLFGSSVIAISVLFVLIRYLYPSTKNGAITAHIFAAQMALHEQAGSIENIAVSDDGQSAIAQMKKQNKYVLLRHLGDRYALRIIAADQVHLCPAQSQIQGKNIKISIADFTWPPFYIPANKLGQIAQNTKGADHA